MLFVGDDFINLFVIIFFIMLNIQINFVNLFKNIIEKYIDGYVFLLINSLQINKLYSKILGRFDGLLLIFSRFEFYFIEDIMYIFGVAVVDLSCIVYCYCYYIYNQNYRYCFCNFFYDGN